MQVYTKNKYMDKLTDELIYQNYHKHSIYTNPIITDSCVYPEEYAQRARDFHHGILSSVEHGYGGRAIEYYEMANKYDLKFVYGVEFYFAFDRFEKDSTNAHMVILAKNENGRKAINRILSEANLTGFYHRGRIDFDLVMSLPEDDVWITTACLGGLWKYDNAKINIHEENLDPKLEKFINMNIALEQHLEFDNIPEMLIVKLHEKFKDNFFLEVQAHQTKAQIEVNKKIVELSKKYNIEIIAGTDSHYIFIEDAWKRDYLQKSSGIFMEEESNWFMDYPDGQTLFNRFKRQGVLDDEDIKIALANTNVLLEVEEYTSEIFQKTMKMPSAVKYRNMSLDEKQLELIKIVKQSWETFKDTIPVEQHAHYLREIAKELDTVFKIKHADYFLLNYELIKDAVENRGGMITFSGRGCVIGNALVKTEKGNKYLNHIQIGDLVLSEDGRYHRVQKVYKYDINEEILEITFGLNKLCLTKDHKIFSVDKEWKEAQQFEVGDIVCGFDLFGQNKNFEITKIKTKWFEGFVYDLQVEDVHSYVAENVVVHNSGPSFILNNLLGFTHIDRISSPITLYPERFLSTSRMTAGSLADIDFNCGNTPVFEESQRYVMGGEEHAAHMIAFGTQKPKAAWKMYCRAVDVPFDISNQISAKIDEYESDLKYWDEDSGEDEPNVYDYIPEDLREYFDKSKEFLGIINSASRHPCFLGDTLVRTDEGLKEIQDIQIGDKVLSHDGNYYEVFENTKNLCNDNYIINITTFDNLSFTVTKNHPILTDVSASYEFDICKDYMFADFLRPGDLLFSPDGTKHIIASIDKIRNNNVYVYNLKVNISNTYTVTSGNIIVHNCGNILYEGNIKEEFGLIRLKSKGGKETVVACIDGKWCEAYLMLKNDLLTVACVKLNYLLYQRVGIPYMSLNQLLEECRQHSEVWDIYEKGYVIGLNQVEKSSTKRKIMKYKPKNISELSALIAGIRPAFKSLIDKLVNREHFEYGIPTLDKLLQTEELPESFILYQEQIMKVLAFAGIPMGDCYTVIKSISKKRFEKIMHYKEQFLTGMSQKLIEAENIDKSRADEVATTIWGIIEDASAYGFNSSHSLSVSFDSLLAAYFKALYPLEFYEVYLNLQMERADKAKAALAKKEAKDAFNIKVLPMRFGQDNRKFTAYPEQNALSNCLKSIKGFGDKIGEEFYKISDRKYGSFLDLLVDIYNIKENKPNKKNYDETKLSGFAVNDTQMEILIRLNYFEQFGKNAKLLKEFKLFSNIYGRKTLNKEKMPKDVDFDMDILQKYIGKETEAQYRDIDFYGYLKETFEKIDDKFLSLPEQLKFERELFEIPVYENKELPDTWEYILSFKTYGDKINTPYLITYNLNNGNLTVCQVSSSKLFRDNPFGIYSIIDIKDMQHPFKKKKVGEKKWETTNEKKNVIANYEVIIRDEIAEKEREEANG